MLLVFVLMLRLLVFSVSSMRLIRLIKKLWLLRVVCSLVNVVVFIVIDYCLIIGGL